MTQSYSLDLRVRVAAFVQAGHSRRAAARHCTCHSTHRQQGGCKSVRFDGQQRDIVRETLGFASAF